MKKHANEAHNANKSQLQTEDWSINTIYIHKPVVFFKAFSSLGIPIQFSTSEKEVVKRVKYRRFVFHTFIHQSHKRRPMVRRGHNHLNDLSNWTMVWHHRTSRCHICCHRRSPGSHTSTKRKKRKMGPLTRFYRKSGPGLQKSSSFSKHILFGWGRSSTLWPRWALGVPVKAPVRNWRVTVDIHVLCLMLNSSLPWITASLVLFLVCTREVASSAPISPHCEDETWN